jgi:hypothetical protein
MNTQCSLVRISLVWTSGCIRPFLLLPTLLLTFLISNAYCQTNSGALVGSVIDKSEAAVPNAKITITNSATGVTLTTGTSSAGDFRVAQLVPGTYSIRAEAPGFQPQVRTGVIIDVSQTSTVNMTLQVGATNEAITVEATNVGIETGTSTIATTVTNELVVDLPLTNTTTQGGERDVLDLQFLTPGTAGSSWQGTVAGGQQFGGEILLDGNSLDTLSGNNADVVNEVPSIEGVQEFTVLSTGLSAEYGRSTNGIINIVSRSGTNKFHGTAYDIVRNTDFDADSWFNNFYRAENCIGANNTAACRSTYATPADKKNNFGVNLGGPVLIPKVYNGKDKTFFFYNWEQVRFSSGGLNVITLPTAANRAGDFSQDIVTSNVLVAHNPCDNNSPIYQGEIFDPATTRTINGVTCRSPFPNNTIPANRLSKVAQNILNYIPLPNVAGTTANYQSSFVNPVISTFETIRVDHSFSDKDKIFGSYNTNEFAGYNGTLSIDTPADETTRQHFITHDINTGWDHFFSPTVENRFNVAFWRFYNTLNTLGVLANQDWPDVLGISGLNGAPGAPFPVINFLQGGYYDTGSAGVGEYLAAQDRISINDHLSWVKARHSLKFGYELRAHQYISWTKGIQSGEFNFANAETAGISSSIAEDGNAFASFMLGQMNSASANSILWYPRYSQYYHALYAQDDYKVTRTLTLNLGLRWDLDLPYHAAGGNSSMFDPTLANPGANGLPGALAFAGSGRSDAWMPTTWTDFGPRIGFAWGPSRFHDKTAIRGSYDIIYGQLPNGVLGADQTGFTSTASYSDSNSVGGFSGTPFTLNQGFPALATTVNTNPSQLNGQPISAINQGTKPARVQMWDLQVQHQLAPDLVFTVSYVGNHDTRLASNLLDINAVPQQYWSLGSELTQPVVGNPYGIPVPYPGFTGTIANALRPYPQYLQIMSADETVGSSTYEALWASLQRHYRNGLTLLFAYTWSKNITDAGWWAIGSNPAVQNPFNISQERALANLNVPQNLSLSYAYELPVGKGRHFLNNSRALDAVVGGWTFAGIHSYASGSPISFGCADQIPGTDNCVRWDFTGSNLLSSSERSGNLNPGVDNYFLNPGQTVHQVFVDPEVNLSQGGGYQLGGLSRYTSARGYSGIGTSGLMESFTLSKQFPIREGLRIEIRLEALNAFNRHQFAVPDSNPNDLAFGVVTASQIAPRQLQLTARIRF